MNRILKNIHNSRIKKFPPYFFRVLDAQRKECEEKGIKLIPMAVGDPDIPTPGKIAEFASREVLKKKHHSYPAGRGTSAFRRAVSEWHKKRFNVALDPESEITLLIGSKEGIAHLPFILMNKGDYAVIPEPSYPAYKTGVILCGGKIRKIALREKNGFLPDLKSLDAKILKKTKIFFINYPNNPTGACATREFFEELVGLAGKYGFLIAQDAAYSELYFSEPPLSILQIPGAKKTAVEFHSLSKTFCMTGWRLAWLAGNRDAIRALASLKENIDSGQFGAIQETAVFALKNYEKLTAPIKKEYGERIRFFRKKLEEAGWRVFSPDATFFLWARPPVKTKSMDCAVKLMKEAGVLASPGIGFGRSCEGYMRFSLTVPLPELKKAAEKINALRWKK